MRAVIVANGWLNQAVEITPDDVLIAADGGARHCLERNLIPAIVIGDLDSLQPDQIAKLESQGAKIVRFPSRKDKTDLELAVDLAENLGASKILILGALGARWDQTIANLLLPATKPSTQIILVDGNQELHFLRGGEQIEICGQPGDVFSLLPLTGEARGITTHNLEFPLNQENLLFGSTRGISNVLKARCATVHLTEGLLLCTVIHQ